MPRSRRQLSRRRAITDHRATLALLGALAASIAHAQQPIGDGPTAASLPSLRTARDRLVEAHDFEAALHPALAAVAEQQASPAEGYGDDLSVLARIEAELEDLTAAEARYLEAVEWIAATEGELSPTLIEVYRGLGRAYVRGARYAEAITTLATARDLSRRHLGLFNLEQSALLDDLTTAYLGLGDTIEARRAQLERLDNAIRRFGANDLRVLPYRYTLADYYLRSRLPDSAREQYEAALETQRAALGETDVALLAPLRELAKLDLRLAQGANADHRDRLIEVLDRNPDASGVERGHTLAVLGDWAIVTEDVAAAHDYYRRAWRSLAERAEVDVAAVFATPAILDFVAPLSPVDRGLRRQPYAWGKVVLEFDVGADGRPAGVRIAGSELGSLQELYARRLRETHFRPRLSAGEPVATTGVRSTHYFRYYVDPDDAD